jgi:hypothetical protein
MTDIQLLKTGFKPWLTAADRARLTALMAEAAAMRECAVLTAETSPEYRAAELVLDAVNAEFRRVHAAHAAGTASAAQLASARAARDSARQALVFAHNAITVEFHDQRKV